MYLFTIVFTIVVLPWFLTIVNVIVKVFIVFYDVFSKFTISLFTILVLGVWRVSHRRGPATRHCRTGSGCLGRGFYVLDFRDDGFEVRWVLVYVSV